MPAPKKTTSLLLRLDEPLKDAAGEICADLGLTVSSAVRLFLIELVRRKELPFAVRGKLPPQNDDQDSGETK